MKTYRGFEESPVILQAIFPFQTASALCYTSSREMRSVFPHINIHIVTLLERHVIIAFLSFQYLIYHPTTKEKKHQNKMAPEQNPGLKRPIEKYLPDPSLLRWHFISTNIHDHDKALIHYDI